MNIKVLNNNLLRFMAEKNTNPQRLSKDAGLGKTAVRDLLEGRVESPRWKTIDALASALGKSRNQMLEEDPQQEAQIHGIPMMGYVGAGGRVNSVPVADREPIDHVDLPRAEDGYECLTVRGDSMMNAFYDNDVLFYRRPAAFIDLRTLYYRDCVLETENGRLYVKRVEPGATSKVVDLISLNDKYPPIKGVALMWAARVLWVKRSGI